MTNDGVMVTWSVMQTNRLPQPLTHFQAQREEREVAAEVSVTQGAQTGDNG